MSQQINLFNPIFLKQKKYFSAVTMLQALGLILAGSAVLSVYANYRLSELTKEADATAAQLKALQTKSEKINAQYALKTKDKALEEEIRKLERQLKPLQQMVGLVQGGDFGNAGGYSEYMRAFARQIVDGVWLTGFAIEGAGNEITIRGRALRPELVPAFIARLGREQSLQGKSFATFDMQLQSAKPEQLAKEGGREAAGAYVDFNLQSSEAGRAGAKNK